MKILSSIILLLFLFACSSVPARPKEEYALGPVDIVMTDAEEIWDRFGCEGHFEVLPDGRYRIWVPNAEYEDDRHAWEVLGHEVSHVLDLMHPVKKNDTPLAGSIE